MKEQCHKIVNFLSITLLKIPKRLLNDLFRNDKIQTVIKTKTTNTYTVNVSGKIKS